MPEMVSVPMPALLTLLGFLAAAVFGEHRDHGERREQHPEAVQRLAAHVPVVQLRYQLKEPCEVEKHGAHREYGEHVDGESFRNSETFSGVSAIRSSNTK